MMNLTIYILLFLIIVGLLSCSQTSTNRRDKESSFEVSKRKEIFTWYKKIDKVIQVVKAIESPDGMCNLYTYEINIGTGGSTMQKFIGVEQIDKEQFEKRKPELKSNYTWIPYSAQEVLFVQIQPANFKDGLQLLSKRQEIEDKIDIALKEANLGEWFAGDVGPGGGNMLYHIDDTNLSLKSIIRVLEENKLEKEVWIGKRVCITNNDWFYEVIYPEKFSGTFNTM